MRRTPPTRVLDHEFDDPARFTGGARVDGASATTPFGELVLDREVARLSFRFVGRTTQLLLRGPIWILRSEVDEVVRTYGTVFHRGIMFAADPGIYDGVIFWTRHRDRLLDAFATRGWPVEAAP